MVELRPAAKLYIATLVLAALALVLATQVGSAALHVRSWPLAAVIVALTAITVAFPLSFGSDAKFSFHPSIVFATALMFTPADALVIAGLGTLVAHVARRRPWSATFFNTAQIGLQAGLGGLLLASLGWRFDQLVTNPPPLMAAVVGVAAAMYGFELLCMAGIMALQQREPLLKIWHQLANFDAVGAVSQFALGLLAAVVVDAYPWALPFLLPPVWAVFRLSVRQMQLHSQSEALAHQAFHDPLTQLPNRALFFDRLQQALARRERLGVVGVLLIDLDHFKAINDTFGHIAGDHLLQAVAERLATTVRPEDTLARFGGDEFMLLVADVPSVNDAIEIAERLLLALEPPFVLEGDAINVSTSIGIALSEAADTAPKELLRAADVALYRAKDEGKARYALFNADAKAVTEENARQVGHT